MISKNQLYNGLIFTSTKKSVIYKTFILWKVGDSWTRIAFNKGQISGYFTNESLLGFLKRHQFKIIGHMVAETIDANTNKQNFYLRGPYEFLQRT